jgi:YVTN family beta-propeller protein
MIAVGSKTRVGVRAIASLAVVGGTALVDWHGGSQSATSTRDAPARAVPAPAEAAPTVPPTTPPTTLPPPPSSAGRRLTLLKTITANEATGPLSPKSIVASGTGVVYAQNMIYSHSISVFDDDGNALAVIPDAVDLAAFGIDGYPPGTVLGGPVELAFSPDRRKAFATNYSMYGPGFAHEGHDTCNPGSQVDPSFVYRIDVTRHVIDQVIPVGTVPKYVAVTPDGRYVLVTNWCSYDLSVIDAARGAEIKRLPMGAYPRGIAVAPDSSRAYVAVMGGTEIRTVDLASFAVTTLGPVGGGPRHVVISPDGAFLYVTLNRDGTVVKVEVATGRVVGSVATGAAPRSMDISADGQSLYIVNYESSTASKVTTADMTEVQELPTALHPIGITYDPGTSRVWVACYSGEIMLFDDA